MRCVSCFELGGCCVIELLLVLLCVLGVGMNDLCCGLFVEFL